MDFALQAALLGAVMGSAILAVSTIYGWTLPSAPAAYGWWAAAFVLETLSKGVLLGGATPLLIELSDIFHGLAAALILVGARVHSDHRLTSNFLVLGLLASFGWFLAAASLRVRLGLADLPLFGIGGVTMIYAAWSFFRVAMGSRSDAKRIAGFCFAAAGLQQLAAPIMHVHPTPATFSFVFSQALSMALAVALMLVVLRRQQGVAESEGQRANLLQSRLVDALGSVQDGVALFDGNDRLVTSNARYRDFLSPVADMIRPGVSFEEILKGEAERGVVPAAKGCEKDWVFDMMADHASFDASPREMQLWDGHWVSVSVYRTADGGHLRILRDDTNRKQAELALQEGVTWLRGIMDTVLDGIVTMDDTGMVLSFNPAAGRIFGYGGDEVVGRSITMLMPDCGFSSGEFAVTPLAGFGRQVKGVRRDGGLFPLELSIAEMRQGDMVTFIAVVRDITDRKRVEDALVESEQRFRDLAESASDWFWEVDEALHFTFVSGRVRQVLGVGPGFFLGRGFQELGANAGSAEDWNEQRMAMNSRLPFRGFVFLHKTAECGFKYVEMSGRPVFDMDGVFRGYRGTATDITPLKRHEQDLAAHAALRQAIVDNMAQGVVVFDHDGTLVALNRHARTMLDLVEREIEPGETTFDAMLLHLAVAGEFEPGTGTSQAKRRLATLRRNPDAVFEHARPNGTVLEVRSNGMPGGGLILTFTDITERKRFEDTLRDAKEAAERGNRAKATFLANISHELRTPLNAIIGFSELIKHEIFGRLEPEIYRTYVGDIHESGMHLLELINDILDMSKAEAGMTDLSESVVDVSVIVESSVRMMLRRAETNQVMLQSNVPEHLPFLRADERRMRQIVLNLMSNAVKFTDEGGKVSVAVHASPATGMEIRVTDTGIGMSAEDIERVMEPFVQADTRLSRKYEGTGLGLPLTKALVEAHGGRLVLESQPGLGTAAIVTFPPERLVPTPEDDPSAEEVLLRG